MIKIFLFGANGKMGKEISSLAESNKKIQIVQKIEKSDVVIDFTNQEAFSKKSRLTTVRSQRIFSRIS